MKKIALGLLMVLITGCTKNDNDKNDSGIQLPFLAPNDLSGEALSSKSILLTWTDRSANETKFEIQRMSNASAYSLVGSVTENTTTFTDTNLNPYQTYTYRVCPVPMEIPSSGLLCSNEFTIATKPQIWTDKNLDVETYSDGTIIPQVTDPKEWTRISTGAWCYYDNDPINGAIYGKLYNWYAVAGIHDNDPNTSNKNLAPNGYHIPSQDEWYKLIKYIDPTAVEKGQLLQSSIAGGKMKEIGTSHWLSPNTGATDSLGFIGLPGGFRYFDGVFYNIGSNCRLWSSTQFYPESAWSRTVDNISSNIVIYEASKLDGFSVRCIKD